MARAGVDVVVRVPEQAPLLYADLSRVGVVDVDVDDVARRVRPCAATSAGRRCGGTDRRTRRRRRTGCCSARPSGAGPGDDRLVVGVDVAELPPAVLVDRSRACLEAIADPRSPHSTSSRYVAFGSLGRRRQVAGSASRRSVPLRRHRATEPGGGIQSSGSRDCPRRSRRRSVWSSARRPAVRGASSNCRGNNRSVKRPSSLRWPWESSARSDARLRPPGSDPLPSSTQVAGVAR